MEEKKVLVKLNAALVKVQASMEAAKKDSRNPAFNSKYADLAAVRDAIKEEFAKHGLGFRHKVTTNIERGSVSVKCVIFHESGEEREPEEWLELPVAKKDPQGYGSAITYGRRYTLMDEVGIIPDDDGNAASGHMQGVAKGADAIPRRAEQARQAAHEEPPNDMEPPHPADLIQPDAAHAPDPEVPYKNGRHAGKRASQLSNKELADMVAYMRDKLPPPGHQYRLGNEATLNQFIEHARSRGLTP